MRNRIVAASSGLIMVLSLLISTPLMAANAAPTPQHTATQPVKPAVTQPKSSALKPQFSKDRRIKPAPDTCKGLHANILREKKRPKTGTIYTCTKPGWGATVKQPAASAYQLPATLAAAADISCGEGRWIETRTHSCINAQVTTAVKEIWYPQGPIPQERVIGRVNTMHRISIDVDNDLAPGKFIYNHTMWLNPEDPGTRIVETTRGPVEVWPGLSATGDAECATSDSCSVTGEFLSQELLPNGSPASGSWTFSFDPGSDRKILYELPTGTFELHSTGPLNWRGGAKELPLRTIRCDNELPEHPITKGCVFPDFRPVMQYTFNKSDWNGFPELAQHIQDAQQGLGTPGAAGGGPLPGAPGVPNKDDGVPLKRASALLAEANRRLACTRSWKKINAQAGKSCDEYPMASAVEGGSSGNFSRRMIDETQNETGGSRMNARFYVPQRVIENDEFYVEIVPCTGDCVPPPPGGSPATTIPPAAALAGLDVSAGNRRAPVAGLYDWSKAGYREGAAGLPSDSDYSTSASCAITAADLAATYGVVPDDGSDDTGGLQSAIDHIKSDCSPDAGFTSLSRIILPAGELQITHQVYVDANYLVISGAGNDSETGTRLVYAPNGDTRYDTISADGTRWDMDAMTSGDDGKGGRMWPGRGMFRVQSRDKHAAYLTDWAIAPGNRKDIFEGTANVHWKVGAKLRAKPGETGFAAREGDTKVYIANNTSTGIMNPIKVGGYINIRAANTMNFYRTMQAVPTDWELQNLHMRQQLFKITGVSKTLTDKWVTIDKPLEYDVPITSISDGSEPITGYTTAYDSKASPLVSPVLGVGIENLYITQQAEMDPDEAKHNYGNMDPAAAMHGIVFKWAVNGFVRGVHTEMTGSHPIVTEEAKNLTFSDNTSTVHGTRAREVTATSADHGSGTRFTWGTPPETCATSPSSGPRREMSPSATASTPT
jgi:hypothetical protein